MTEQFEIVDGRRTPPRRGNERSRQNWPFASMAIGQSFLVADPALYRKAINAAAQHKRRSGRVIEVRRTPGGFTCWRKK